VVTRRTGSIRTGRVPSEPIGAAYHYRKYRRSRDLSGPRGAEEEGALVKTSKEYNGRIFKFRKK